MFTQSYTAQYSGEYESLLPVQIRSNEIEIFNEQSMKIL